MKDSISHGGYNRYGYNSSVQSEAAANTKAPIQKKKKSSIQSVQKKEDNRTQPKEDPISKFHALKASNKAPAIQKKKEHEEEEIQLKKNELVPEPIQHKKEEEKVQLKEISPSQPNNTGLPDNLKAGVENLSGLSMDHVKVHYNSDKPAQLQAHAYAQGNDIHVAPGQEKHLPHEAWHIVQQAQGRVKPTTSVFQPSLQRRANTDQQLQDQVVRPNIAGQSSVVQRVLDQKVVDEILAKDRPKLTLSDFESHTDISVTTLDDVLSDVISSSPELEAYSDLKATKVLTKLRGYPDKDHKFIFENYFSKKVWVMATNFNSRELGEVNLNDVVAWQAKIAGCDGKPEYIVRHNIVNEVAREEANNARDTHGKHLVELDTDEGKIFINDTDNGRSTVRILQDYGLRPLSMQVVGATGDPSVIIKTEPGEWKLPPRTKREIPPQKEKVQDNFRTGQDDFMTNLDTPMMGDLKKVSAKKKSSKKSSSKKHSSKKGSSKNYSSKKGSSDKRKCFLTTACVTARGLPDDCYELTTLRGFRDGYMRRQEDGPAMIEDYYRLAPKIVDAIHEDPAAEVIMNEIYATILNCIDHIESNRPESTLMIYRSMVLELAEKYSI